MLFLVSLLGVLAIMSVSRRLRCGNATRISKLDIPLSHNNEISVGARIKLPDYHGPPDLKPSRDAAGHKVDNAIAGRVFSRESLEAALVTAAFVGDYVMILLGFFVAFLIYHGNASPNYSNILSIPSFPNLLELLLLGSAIVVWGLTGKHLYCYRSFLFPSQVWKKAVAAMGIFYLVLIGLCVLLRIIPQLAWTYYVFAAILISINIYAWRLVLSRIVQLPVLASLLRRRVIVIGGGSQTLRIKKALEEKSDMQFVGWVQAIKPNRVRELSEYRMGSLHELGNVLKTNSIDIAVLMESESLQREGVSAVAKACENEHVQFKMIPHFFDILISGLHPEHIGGVQLLGIDCLPLSGYRNRLIKRAIDLIGATVGLAVSVPIILICGILVYREAPGPILYKQLRQGRNGREFYILKIRSMQVNAEANGKAQWAKQNDQRRLRIGTFMRKWNIDEVPQFWNVFVGEMSLVGPRPERPELIARFKTKFPHYQARHIYRPGITGWAQVNGWRGDTDLDERIRHDIWYLEHWSVWLDCRIMIQTFFRRENAY